MYKRVTGAAAPLLIAISGLAMGSAMGLAQSATTTAKPTPAPQTKSSSVPPLPSASRPGEPPVPAHPVTLAQVHELMALNGEDHLKTRLVDNGNAAIQRFPPFVPEDVKQDVRSSLEKIDVDGPAVSAYQKALSTEDAAKAIDFYKTPAGKNFLAASPLISSEIQQGAVRSAQEAFQGAIQRHRTEIEAAQKTYAAAHPAPSLGAPEPGSRPGPGVGSGAETAPKTAPAPSTPKKPQ